MGLRYTIISLTVAALMWSCNNIARIGYGAKKSKAENKISIESWLEEKGFSRKNVWSISPEHYYDLSFGLPQAPMLFDNKTGNFLAVGFADGKYCPKEVDKSFAAVLPYNIMKEKPDSFLISERIIIPPGGSIQNKESYVKEKDTTVLKIGKIFPSLRDLSGNEIIPGTMVDADYTLLLPFAVFLGNKLQVEDLKKFYFSALQNRFSRINIVFLNLDKQEWWGKEWNEKIKINYK